MNRLIGMISGAFLVCISLLGIHLWKLPHGELLIDFLDVGQGDSILITTPDQHHILIDGGPEQKVLEELGDVLPFFQRTIDLLVLTHPHADHAMGLVQVLKRYEVKAVLFSGLNYPSSIYDAFLKEIQRQSIPLHVAEVSTDWKIPLQAHENHPSHLFFDVLYPFASMVGDTMDNVNNGSIVMMVHYGEHRILLSGDLEIEGEQELLATDLDLRAELFKAGHHGSRTSSTWDFLQRVQPKTVVIQCGKDNDYHHPHPETLEHLAKMGIEVHRNDLEGRVRIRITNEEITNY